MLRIDPEQEQTPKLHQYLVGSVAPRPIAFASTISADGTPNLAPYSFFNVFSSNPPTLVFSSNRRVSNNTTKDTLHNVQENGEVVINVVSFQIVRQMAITSIEYASDVSEFGKAGLTPIPSEIIKPFRVKESPVQMECKVQQIVPLGESGGAGHLIICKVVLMHIDERVLDEEGRINPHKIDLMGRLGRAYYVRASGESIHKIYQSVKEPSIGFDRLPPNIKTSRILTANNLAQLAGMSTPPTHEDLLRVKESEHIQEVLQAKNPVKELHRMVQLELSKENREYAAQLAWLGELVE